MVPDFGHLHQRCSVKFVVRSEVVMVDRIAVHIVLLSLSGIYNAGGAALSFFIYIFFCTISTRQKSKYAKQYTISQ